MAPAVRILFAHGGGTASYYDVVVNDVVNKDAAWYYPEPKAAAANIKSYVAFWKDIEVEN